MKHRGWLVAGFVLAGAVAMAAGFFASGLWLSGGNSLKGEPAPAVELTDLGGQTRTLTQWQGKLLLVNFWASWCAPCVDEIPLLVEAQARYGAQGLQVLGPAFDEPEPTRQMVQRLRINYPVSANLAQADAAARALGNSSGMLPYSVLISRDGRVLKTILGSLTREQLDTLVQEHL
ncbi:TlpA family protein disulfide reductase [Solimonas sp. K1W22B-7]|uniref:TlpA family protein disulfide reductase n=1 Tax=Solimonas sp. K1W22B-7 TaxID=2303331 RepID=UPI000E33657B|nr:TlpA disulfide reductase family protein [Solimonas sp. K1W22B-7]AXQ29875.1 TlpA family protein disulfide reductase [Solimonas sp. K1W22B-7]